ncbi:MAG: HupE/UreJ family protein [Pseudomonadota bacterium]
MTNIRTALLAALALTVPQMALAHTVEGTGNSLYYGFMHPLLGTDHVLAMVAVGIWGSILGRPLLVALPIAFPLMMVVGAVLGLAGVPFPPVEVGIALSAVVLGAVIVFLTRPPLWVALTLVGVFGLFHGYAHGAELSPDGNASAFALGFIAATGMLHGFGILIGEGVKLLPRTDTLYRATGAVISAFGLVFLSSALA